MWTDLTFNLILLIMSDYLFILAASNVGYIIFNFLNLNAGWIHRVEAADMLADLAEGGGKLGEKRAGMLPYITLTAGVVTVAVAYLIYWT